jgi:AcrR family transcriptional regulator
MPKITDLQRETRRQQILDAARRCFSRDGFHNTTTADIVRESGVSQGTLYVYFTTKDDIILALADDRHQAEAFVSALAQSEQDPIEGLAVLLELHGDSLVDRHRLDARRVGVQGWAEALRNPVVHDSISRNIATVRQEIAGLIARGQAAGQIRAEVEPLAVAQVLIALFQGLTLSAALHGDAELAGVGVVIRDMIRSALFTEAARAAHPRFQA